MKKWHISKGLAFQTYCGLENPQNLVFTGYENLCQNCAKSRRKDLEKYLEEAKSLDKVIKIHE
jgi:hypothetical protein